MVLSMSALFGIYKREEKARLQGGNFHQGTMIIDINVCTVCGLDTLKMQSIHADSSNWANNFDQDMMIINIIFCMVCGLDTLKMQSIQADSSNWVNWYILVFKSFSLLFNGGQF